MAKKANVGNSYYKFLKRQERLVKKLDKRSKSGKDRENVDHIFQNHSFTPNGERVWSF